MPRELTESERQEFLAAKHVAVISVAATDGRPPASVPIWYDYTPGGNIRITTGASRRKARLIKQNGVLTLVVQNEEPPYQYVSVEGSVVEVTEPTPAEVAEGIAVRYLGEQAGRQFASSLEGEQTVLFTIRPDRWFSVDYSE
ncbi:pyridoxamine 5'-phosphate oxidase family protein [Mycobacterium sp. EPa45]|uniref:pyridoxamine 5'-phosphate oxidase family protein n=1 Tax=Mycobacterium sp. EPa45 TaxID=1545728 RepID=UPI0006422A7F|nr:pyridoxamine 5'-phosphate oxidase family protein [Mycobacterium sp. EPa45]AKK27945.1 pyridoxamine 5-phosphate oxidase [Mycobacterium sp. EPa45]